MKLVGLEPKAKSTVLRSHVIVARQSVNHFEAYLAIGVDFLIILPFSQVPSLYILGSPSQGGRGDGLHPKLILVAS